MVRKLSLVLFFGLFGFAATVLGQNSALDSLKNTVNHLVKDVEASKNLKISGWIQAQYQWTDTKGAKTYDGGDFLANSNNRFMIRRGRVKFVYTKGIAQYVLQVNASERGVNLVDLYAKLTDPWTKSLSLTAGVMNRPFGFEIQQSSVDRETPERSRFTQMLLPNERDLGAMLTFQPIKGKKLYGLKVDGGFYNGTGIAVPGTTSLNGAGVVDFDSFKDFMGRAHYKRSWKDDKVSFGVGVSHYNGGFVYQNNRVYSSFQTDSLGAISWQMKDTTNGTTFKNKKAPRIYFGGDLQFSFKSVLGTTTLRGEYITGQQAGVVDESKSPSTLPSKMETYIRNFDGGYAYLIQRIGKSKHELALKYEWYDPNTNFQGSDVVALNALTKAELKYTMIGLGYNCYLNENLKFMVYYNMVSNESTNGISGYARDLKDDVLTVRMQIKF
ncbi:MAG: hypothetical protein WC044_14245 [Crocinitomicaceae bacterium]